MRFAEIDGAPKRCTLVKLYTNQGIVGYGEVRDASSATYAAMLKSRIIGENPCNVEKVFRRIKQFGGDSRQAGGVCAIEVACWDIAGKVWGVPVWQLLGGKFRDKIRCYCDTDSEGHGSDMGKVLDHDAVIMEPDADVGDHALEPVRFCRSETGIIDPELDQLFAVSGRENIAPLSDTSDFSKNF